MNGEALLVLGMSPLAIALAIVLATFVLEDAAIIGAALLAASGMISVPLAFSALTLGIFVGDLGLYGLGRAARTHAWSRNRIGEHRIAQGRDWLGQRLVLSLLAARFIPGSRLPTYAASGFLAVPFSRFALVTGGAGIVWTGLVFGVTLMLGAPVLMALGPWKWLAGAVLLVTLIAIPRLLRSQDV